MPANRGSRPASSGHGPSHTTVEIPLIMDRTKSGALPLMETIINQLLSARIAKRERLHEAILISAPYHLVLDTTNLRNLRCGSLTPDKQLLHSAVRPMGHMPCELKRRRTFI